MGRRSHTTAGWHVGLALLLLLATMAFFAGALRSARAADEAWETEVRREEAEEDRLLDRARRRGTIRQVVVRYASRLDRQPGALSHYLVGRALYYDGNPAATEEHLKEALRLQPGFWFAKLRLAMLEVERKRPQEARRYVTAVLRTKPREKSALRLLAQIEIEAKDYDAALRAMDVLLSLDPADDVVRRNMAFCYLAKKDWAGALRELRVLRGRRPKDLGVRGYYAQALYESGAWKEAAREFESLVRVDARDVRSFDMLRLIYMRLEDWENVQRTLERMLPLVPEGTSRKKLEDVLARLEAGERPTRAGSKPKEGDEAWRRDTMAELIERCMDPTDVKVRREALQAYYEAKPPLMPSALVRRIHPDLEPDPTCRKWLLRIMASLRNAELAQVAAFGLYDPDSSVRSLAAESLGEIRTPAGVLYLLPYFLGTRLDEPPSKAQVREQNAARAALIEITMRHDRFGGADAWVEADGLAVLRDDWERWLATPAGVEARLEAIMDLEKLGELRPQFYLIEDVMDPEPRIARAAYGVLRREADKSHAEASGQALWGRFPRFEDAQLVPGNMGQVRGAVKAWWDGWLVARREGKASPADAPAQPPGTNGTEKKDD